MPARPASISICTSNNPTSFAASKSPFSPLPSELPRTPVHGHFAALKHRDEAIKTPITPPAAYTDFLKNTVNSPAIASPRHSLSLPSPASAGGPFRRHSYGYYTPSTPYPAAAAAAAAPVTATGTKRLRIPPSPCSIKSTGSAGAESPKSSTSSSPASEEEVDGEVTRSREPRQVTVKQVVTTTATYSAPRTMSLLPAPKGKRRKIN